MASRVLVAQQGRSNVLGRQQQRPGASLTLTGRANILDGFCWRVLRSAGFPFGARMKNNKPRLVDETVRNPKAAELYQQVCDSTARNRQFFFLWVAFSLYVVVTTTSTTDLQLLLPHSSVVLPTLGIQLPLIGYFVVVPWLVLALHFNLLQNLDTHAYKLDRWAKCYPEGVPPRSSLQAFAFDFAMLERGSAFDRATRFSVELLCYALGPITLAVLVWRFSDYQSLFYTASQSAAFAVDLAIVWIARRNLPGPAGSVSSGGRRIGHVLKDWLLRRLLKWSIYWGPAAIVALQLAWGIRLGMPGGYQELSWLDPTPFSILSPKIELPRNLSLPNTKQATSNDLLDDERDINATWLDRGSGADLGGRSLQGARFERIYMRKVNFREARLGGARFDFSNLQGADLTNANLDQASFWNARAQDARFFSASLYGAQLLSGSYHGADFSYADLRAANGNLAQLQGAGFEAANLSGATLLRAKLQGATLKRARLMGARLSGADLTGAVISDTEINFEPADVKGKPLVILPGWIVGADEADWEWMPALRGITRDGLGVTRIQVDGINEALERARKPPAIGLQRELDSWLTQPPDYELVAGVLVEYFCDETRRWNMVDMSFQLSLNWIPADELLMDRFSVSPSCSQWKPYICDRLKTIDEVAPAKCLNH